MIMKYEKRFGTLLILVLNRILLFVMYLKNFSVMFYIF